MFLLKKEVKCHNIEEYIMDKDDALSIIRNVLGDEFCDQAENLLGNLDTIESMKDEITELGYEIEDLNDTIDNLRYVIEDLREELGEKEV